MIARSDRQERLRFYQRDSRTRHPSPEMAPRIGLQESRRTHYPDMRRYERG